MQGIWTPVRTFPSSDGSRIFRVSIPLVVVESLYRNRIDGVRHTVAMSAEKNTLSRTEVRDFITGTWMDMERWLERRLRQESENDLAVYPVLEEIRKGGGDVVSLVETRQRDVEAPSGSERIVMTTSVVMKNGVSIDFVDFLARRTPQVEMCCPLSNDEASSMLDKGEISAVRHTYISTQDDSQHLLGSKDSQHHVEVFGSRESCWLPLSPIVPFVAPHFRIHYTTNSNAKRVSQTPW